MTTTIFRICFQTYFFNFLVTIIFYSYQGSKINWLGINGVGIKNDTEKYEMKNDGSYVSNIG